MLARWLLRAVTFAAVIVCASVPDSNAELETVTFSASSSTAAETVTKKTSVSATFSDLAGMRSNDASTAKPNTNDSNGARQGSEHKENITASKTETKVDSGDGTRSSNSGLSSHSETESSMRLTSERKEKSSSAKTNSVTISDETGSKTNREAEDNLDFSSKKKKSSMSNRDRATRGDMAQVAGAMSSSGDDTQEVLPSDSNVKQENEDDEDEDKRGADKMTKAKRKAAKEARYKAEAERKAKRAAQKKEWRKIKQQHKAELKAAKARARSDTSAIHGAGGNATETAMQE